MKEEEKKQPQQAHDDRVLGTKPYTLDETKDTILFTLMSPMAKEDDEQAPNTIIGSNVWCNATRSQVVVFFVFEDLHVLAINKGMYKNPKSDSTSAFETMHGQDVRGKMQTVRKQPGVAIWGAPLFAHCDSLNPLPWCYMTDAAPPDDETVHVPHAIWSRPMFGSALMVLYEARQAFDKFAMVFEPQKRPRVETPHAYIDNTLLQGRETPYALNQKPVTHAAGSVMLVSYNPRARRLFVASRPYVPPSLPTPSAIETAVAWKEVDFGQLLVGAAPKKSMMTVLFERTTTCPDIDYIGCYEMGVLCGFKQTFPSQYVLCWVARENDLRPMQLARFPLEKLDALGRLLHAVPGPVRLTLVFERGMTEMEYSQHVKAKYRAYLDTARGRGIRSGDALEAEGGMEVSVAGGSRLAWETVVLPSYQFVSRIQQQQPPPFDLAAEDVVQLFRWLQFSSSQIAAVLSSAVFATLHHVLDHDRVQLEQETPQSTAQKMATTLAHWLETLVLQVHLSRVVAVEEEEEEQEQEEHKEKKSNTNNDKEELTRRLKLVFATELRLVWSQFLKLMANTCDAKLCQLVRTTLQFPLRQRRRLRQVRPKGNLTPGDQRLADNTSLDIAAQLHNWSMLRWVRFHEDEMQGTLLLPDSYLTIHQPTGVTLTRDGGKTTTTTAPTYDAMLHTLMVTVFVFMEKWTRSEGQRRENNTNGKFFECLLVRGQGGSDNNWTWPVSDAAIANTFQMVGLLLELWLDCLDRREPLEMHLQQEAVGLHVVSGRPTMPPGLNPLPHDYRRCWCVLDLHEPLSAILRGWTNDQKQFQFNQHDASGAWARLTGTEEHDSWITPVFKTLMDLASGRPSWNVSYETMQKCVDSTGFFDRLVQWIMPIAQLPQPQQPQQKQTTLLSWPSYIPRDRLGATTIIASHTIARLDPVPAEGERGEGEEKGKFRLLYQGISASDLRLRNNLAMPAADYAPTCAGMLAHADAIYHTLSNAQDVEVHVIWNPEADDDGGGEEETTKKLILFAGGSSKQQQSKSARQVSQESSARLVVPQTFLTPAMERQPLLRLSNSGRFFPVAFGHKELDDFRARHAKYQPSAANNAVEPGIAVERVQQYVHSGIHALFLAEVFRVAAERNINCVVADDASMLSLVRAGLQKIKHKFHFNQDSAETQEMRVWFRTLHESQQVDAKELQAAYDTYTSRSEREEEVETKMHDASYMFQEGALSRRPGSLYLWLVHSVFRRLFPSMPEEAEHEAEAKSRRKKHQKQAERIVVLRGTSPTPAMYIPIAVSMAISGHLIDIFQYALADTPEQASEALFLPSWGIARQKNMALRKEYAVQLSGRGPYLLQRMKRKADLSADEWDKICKNSPEAILPPASAEVKGADPQLQKYLDVADELLRMQQAWKAELETLRKYLNDDEQQHKRAKTKYKDEGKKGGKKGKKTTQMDHDQELRMVRRKLCAEHCARLEARLKHFDKRPNLVYQAPQPREPFLTNVYGLLLILDIQQHVEFLHAAQEVFDLPVTAELNKRLWREKEEYGSERSVDLRRQVDRVWNSFPMALAMASFDDASVRVQRNKRTQMPVIAKGTDFGDLQTYMRKHCPGGLSAPRPAQRPPVAPLRSPDDESKLWGNDKHSRLFQHVDLLCWLAMAKEGKKKNKNKDDDKDGKEAAMEDDDGKKASSSSSNEEKKDKDDDEQEEEGVSIEVAERARVAWRRLCDPPLSFSGHCLTLASQHLVQTLRGLSGFRESKAKKVGQNRGKHKSSTGSRTKWLGHFYGEQVGQVQRRIDSAARHAEPGILVHPDDIARARRLWDQTLGREDLDTWRKKRRQQAPEPVPTNFQVMYDNVRRFAKGTKLGDEVRSWLLRAIKRLSPVGLSLAITPDAWLPGESSHSPLGMYIKWHYLVNMRGQDPTGTVSAYDDVWEALSPTPDQMARWLPRNVADEVATPEQLERFYQHDAARTSTAAGGQQRKPQRTTVRIVPSDEHKSLIVETLDRYSLNAGSDGSMWQQIRPPPTATGLQQQRKREHLPLFVSQLWRRFDTARNERGLDIKTLTKQYGTNAMSSRYYVLPTALYDLLASLPAEQRPDFLADWDPKAWLRLDPDSKRSSTMAYCAHLNQLREMQMPLDVPFLLGPPPKSEEKKKKKGEDEEEEDVVELHIKTENEVKQAMDTSSDAKQQQKQLTLAAAAATARPLLTKNDDLYVLYIVLVLMKLTHTSMLKPSSGSVAREAGWTVLDVVVYWTARKNHRVPNTWDRPFPRPTDAYDAWTVYQNICGVLEDIEERFRTNPRVFDPVVNAILRAYMNLGREAPARLLDSYRDACRQMEGDASPIPPPSSSSKKKHRTRKSLIKMEDDDKKKQQVAKMEDQDDADPFGVRRLVPFAATDRQIYDWWSTFMDKYQNHLRVGKTHLDLVPLPIHPDTFNPCFLVKNFNWPAMFMYTECIYAGITYDDLAQCIPSNVSSVPRAMTPIVLPNGTVEQLRMLRRPGENFRMSHALHISKTVQPSRTVTLEPTSTPEETWQLPPRPNQKDKNSNYPNASGSQPALAAVAPLLLLEEAKKQKKGRKRKAAAQQEEDEQPAWEKEGENTSSKRARTGKEQNHESMDVGGDGKQQQQQVHAWKWDVCVSTGEKQGSKAGKTMQDRIVQFSSMSGALRAFAILDGHGVSNAAVDWLALHLPAAIRDVLDKTEKEAKLVVALGDRLGAAIEELDLALSAAMATDAKKDRTKPQGGSTLCLVVCDLESASYWVANLGDTRAVLYPKQQTEPLQLTVDHRVVDLPQDELQRIHEAWKKNDAAVTMEIVDQYMRGTFKPKEGGGGNLGQSLTRAFGNELVTGMKLPGLSAKPFVTPQPRVWNPDTDDFLVIASDGVLLNSKLGNDKVGEIVKKDLLVDAGSCAQALCNRAGALTADDVSAVVIQFRQPEVTAVAAAEGKRSTKKMSLKEMVEFKSKQQKQKQQQQQTTPKKKPQPKKRKRKAMESDDEEVEDDEDEETTSSSDSEEEEDRRRAARRNNKGKQQSS